MRKIISILLALGMVLALSVMATPVSAAVSGVSVVVFDTECACDKTAGYNITFNISASLTEGVGCVCIKFPVGTTVPATFLTGDITINNVSVFKEEITVSGTEVCFIPPAEVAAGAQVVVTFKTIADIGNPCTPGKYTLEVKTCRAPDSTYVKSAEYTIKPAYSTYKFELDFGPTYPGIAKDFIPPFKACGQNDTGQAFDTTFNASLMDGKGGWFEAFNLTFAVNVTGCAAPCTNVTLWAEVISIPGNETLTIWIPGEVPQDVMILTSANITKEVGKYGSEDLNWTGGATLPLTILPRTLTVQIHFSSPGTYEFCLYAECPATDGCDPAASAIIASRCFKAKVYQWKDAAKLVLDEKWNLISLPLVPLVDPPILDLLASIPAADRANILSIWHYDRCAGVNGTWYVWGSNGFPAGSQVLSTLVDGKAYWMRLKYPLTNCGNITWWVWGTEKPMPPASPADYKVCEGWNMVGFLGTATNVTPAAYLWNWDSPKPVVYGWDPGCWNVQNWNLINGAETLVPGQGYWVAFPADGDIFVP